ncbi:hypothetical protein ECANGB1_637 [Enterospora canceri]|uniref:Uncharacterized protein n=1 Tax=Enterospora canceri TaxID=1081671 RepID=A0A1Y1S7P9_9MICR|nr:hypothetical protein ECANGB1_637 [Enterospora canceri]
MFFNTALICSILSVMAKDNLQKTFDDNSVKAEEKAIELSTGKYLLLKNATLEKGVTDAKAFVAEKVDKDAEELDMKTFNAKDDGFTTAAAMVGYLTRLTKVAAYMAKDAADQALHKEVVTEIAADAFTQTVPTEVASMMKDVFTNKVKEDDAKPKDNVKPAIEAGVKPLNAYVCLSKIKDAAKKDEFVVFVTYKSDNKEHKSKLMEVKFEKNEFTIKVLGAASGSGSGSSDKKEEGMSKGIKITLIVGGLLLLAAAIGIGIYFYMASQKKKLVDEENMAMSNAP